MAYFCNLCGYYDKYCDIDVLKLYNEHIKPTIKEDFKEVFKKNKNINDLEGKFCISLNVGGICESCRLVHFFINHKMQAVAVYYDNDNHIFGYIDKKSYNLIIDENDIFYSKKRLKVKKEMERAEKIYFKEILLEKTDKYSRKFY